MESESVIYETLGAVINDVLNLREAGIPCHQEVGRECRDLHSEIKRYWVIELD